MKIIVLTLALATLAAGAYAQKSKLRNAKEYVRDEQYKKAIPEIDAAAEYNDTKNDPEVWFLRGIIYGLQAADSTARTPNSTNEAYRSYIKAAELKPNYQGDPARLYMLAYVLYTDGSTAFNKGDYGKAYEGFSKAYDLYSKTSKITIPSDPNADKAGKAYADLATAARTNAALSAINDKKYDEALNIYRELKNTQTPKDSNTYFALVEILERQEKNDELIAVVTEARGIWPNNRQFINSELNYYIKAGKPEVLLGKLESATTADPNNADLFYNLGNIYESMSFPKGADKKPTTRPANAAESFSKAEEAYKKAIAINGSNAVYHYNYGVLFYEYALMYNLEANGIKGTSVAENKKFDELLAKRNAQFKLAVPHFETAFNLLDPKAPNLNGEDMITYKNSITGLYEIFSRIDDKAKLAEIKKKYDAAKSM